MRWIFNFATHPPGKRDRGHRREVGSRVSAHHGPGEATLTSSILVRVQVPQPGILLKSLRNCSFLARRKSLKLPCVARVGQQGTLTRIWAKRGVRPRIKRDRRFTWAYLFGAICPARGTGAALVVPTVGIEAMNQHLAEISTCVSVRAIALLILDGAGWHSSPQLTCSCRCRPMRRS